MTTPDKAETWRLEKHITEAAVGGDFFWLKAMHPLFPDKFYAIDEPVIDCILAAASREEALNAELAEHRDYLTNTLDVSFAAVVAEKVTLKAENEALVRALEELNAEAIGCMGGMSGYTPKAFIQRVHLVTAAALTAHRTAQEGKA